MNADYQYLVAKIQCALAADPRVNMLDIKIIVIQNRVHLTGEVMNEERRAAAADVVSAVAPGIEVRNELRILDVSLPAEPEVIVD
jgi:osmotically-inducible protein OsmY